MARVTLVAEADASGEVRSCFDDIKSTMEVDQVPAFFRVQGASTAALTGTWHAVRGLLFAGVVERRLKEAIIFAISASRQCSYCTAAHLAVCRAMDFDESRFERLEGKERAMVQFAVQAGRDPQGLTEADFAKLRDHGVGDAAIGELIAVAGLALMLNVVADSTQVPIDAHLEGVDQ